MNKTQALIIFPKLNETFRCTILSINNFSILIVNSFKYLGVISDNELSFKDHTDNIFIVTSKISKLKFI